MAAYRGRVEVYDSVLESGCTQFQEEELLPLENAELMAKVKQIMKEVNQQMVSSGLASSITRSRILRFTMIGFITLEMVNFLFLCVPQMWTKFGLKLLYPMSAFAFFAILSRILNAFVMWRAQRTSISCRWSLGWIHWTRGTSRIQSMFVFVVWRRATRGMTLLS